jgi:hypothetical protein
MLGKGSGSGESSFGIIETTLRAGSIKATLDSIDGSHESTLAIEREADGEPRLFHDGVREHASTGEFSQIEVFSQGDLQRIASDQGDGARVDLIDRRHSLRIKEMQNQGLRHV